MSRLKQRIKQPLPGQSAQKLMAPVNSDQRRFNLEDYASEKKGAVLILFYPGGNGIKFPLMERHVYEGIHSGQISLPGGKKEESDQNLIETALRESKEEIGIDPGAVSIIGSLTELYITVSKIRVKPVVGYLNSVPDFVPDPSEVKKLLNADLFQLTDKENVKTKEILVERDLPEGSFNYRLQAPYFDVNGHVVWGATAMILSELVTIVREIY